AAATKRKTVDRCDHDLGHPRDIQADLMRALSHGARRGGAGRRTQLVDIGASDKGLLAVSSDYRHAQPVVLLDLAQRAVDLSAGGFIQRIEHFLPIDSDRRHRAVAIKDDVFVGHANPQHSGVRSQKSEDSLNSDDYEASALL